MVMQTLPEEREEVVIWEGSHALCDDVAGQAELHRDAAVIELLFQVVIQAAHMAQPVWSKVQDLLCLQRVVHLQGGDTYTRAHSSMKPKPCHNSRLISAAARSNVHVPAALSHP